MKRTLLKSDKPMHLNWKWRCTRTCAVLARCAIFDGNLCYYWVQSKLKFVFLYSFNYLTDSVVSLKKKKKGKKMCCTVHLSAVIMPVNCGAPLCVQFYRWLCRVSWLWPPAPAQHLPPWPEDLRLWRRKGADDGCCFCQGNYVTVLED